jgi:3-hydroxyisobutyrate dehydrogenase
MTGTNENSWTVGLIGLGAMGRGVAENLIAKGYRVVGFDIRPEMRGWLTERGGIFGKTLADVARQCQTVISFVVNDAQTEAVLFGCQGLVGALLPGSVVVTCSTMSPDYVGQLAARLSEHSIRLIDAPVTGGAVGAAKGTLTVMAAGDETVFRRIKPVLDAFGAHVHYVSEKHGAGSQLKVINQLLCGVHLAAAGEALALAKRQGLPLDTTMEVLCSGAASSWMLCDRGPRMVRGAFGEVTSAVDIFVKDLGLVLDAARSAKFAASLASAAHNAFLAVSGGGKGRWDDSSVMTNYGTAPYGGEIPFHAGSEHE